MPAHHDLGFVPFDEFLSIQDQYWEKRRGNEIPDTILFAEHPTCISLGARPQEHQLPFLRVLLSDLQRRDIGIHKTLRGGSITVHTRGILGCYFILKHKQGATKTVKLLEKIAQDVFTECGIMTTPLPPNAPNSPRYHGAWTKNGKIASIGIRISRNVTRFGISINVNPDPEVLSIVHPCGITDWTFTSLANEKRDVSVAEVLKIAKGASAHTL